MFSSFQIKCQTALFPSDKDFNITVEKLRRKEKVLSEDKIQENREKIQRQRNDKKKKYPDINEGDMILYQGGRDNKERKLEGPVTVDKVIKKDGVPKTMIVTGNDGKSKAIALKNSLPYKQRTLFSTTILGLLTICCIVTIPSSAMFLKESDVLWAPSNIPVLNSMINVDHTFAFQTVCKPFMTASSLDPHQVRDLNVWCRKKLDAVFDVFVTICPHDNLTDATTFSDRQLSRQKREPVTLTILAASALTYVASTITTSLLNSDMKDKIIANQLEISRLENENVRNQEHMKTLISDVEDMLQRLEVLETRVMSFVNLYPNMTALIADTSSSLNTMALLANKMKRRWMSEHELPEELFDLFDSANGTRLPDNSIYRLAIPLSCRSNGFRGSVNLRYQIPLGTHDAKILKPFLSMSSRTSLDQEMRLRHVS